MKRKNIYENIGKWYQKLVEIGRKIGGNVSAKVSVLEHCLIIKT